MDYSKYSIPIWKKLKAVGPRDDDARIKYREF
jgi:hypothetical protein